MSKKRFIPVANPTVDIEEAKAVYNQVKSGWISMGKKVQEFENAWIKKFKCKYSIAMNSNTSGLFAAMGAIELSPGDEVIVPPLSMSATAI